MLQIYCCRVLHMPVQSATPGQTQQWQQEQQTYKDSVRTSTPATIQNALNNFNGVQMNPSKLYAPGAPPSNNAPLTPQEQGTVAAPQASQPATVVCKPFPQLLSHQHLQRCWIARRIRYTGCSNTAQLTLQEQLAASTPQGSVPTPTLCKLLYSH